MQRRSGRGISIDAKYYGLLACLVLAYLVTVIFFQPDSTLLSRYHLNDTQYRLLSLTVVIPVIAIWFGAFYSFVKLGNYVKKIENTPDGREFAWLYAGLVAFGLGLPLGSLISRLLTYGARQSIISQSFATIVGTHITLVFVLIGSILLVIGSWRLMSLVKKARVPHWQTLGAAVALIILSIIYGYAALHNPLRQTTGQPLTTAAYAMPDWLIFTTIVLPYIVAWACGFYTTLWLHTYHHHVNGKIYRRALKRLNTGVFIVIFASVLVRLLTNMPTNIADWGLRTMLLLLYALLFIIAVGYVLIALGAKGLSRLEEVT